jgi:hypothetical protein
MLRKLIVLVSVVFIFLTSTRTSSPDYAIWAILFGMAVISGFMAIKDLWPWFVFAALSLAYFGATFYFWPSTFEGFFYDGLALKPSNVEQARDAATAFFVGVYMLVLAYLVKERKLEV